MDLLSAATGAITCFARAEEGEALHLLGSGGAAASLDRRLIPAAGDATRDAVSLALSNTGTVGGDDGGGDDERGRILGAATIFCGGMMLARFSFVERTVTVDEHSRVCGKRFLLQRVFCFPLFSACSRPHTHQARS